jgi:hypothetical protein
MKKESYQHNISLSLMNGEESGSTLIMFTTGIGQPRAFDCQLLPTAKGVNSSNMELFDVVACLEPNLKEFGRLLDQSCQAVVHRWLILLILDDRGEHDPISPWHWFVHIHQDPPPLGSFPATFEGSQNIFVTMVVTQREPDSAINDFAISCGGVIIPEQTGVRHDSKPTFAEHYKDTQCRNDIGIEVEQFTIQIAHDGYQEHTRQKS